jgi:hypothetical protein
MNKQTTTFFLKEAVLYPNPGERLKLLSIAVTGKWSNWIK